MSFNTIEEAVQDIKDGKVVKVTKVTKGIPLIENDIRYLERLEKRE